MKYIFLANNKVGYEVLQWLVEAGYPPAGLVVHPQEKAKFRAELIAVSGLSPQNVLEAPQLRSSIGLDWLNAHAPDWLFSVYFGYILKPAVLEIPKNGVVNLHPSFLPYNKGAYPNVWSIIDKTPAGVSLHFIDAGVDTGDLIAQKEVVVLPTDTGQTLYAKLDECAHQLFIESWQMFVENKVPRVAQPQGGTAHKVAEVAQIDALDPNQLMRVGDLIDVLRARTFPPYKGAFLDLPDRRVYMNVQMFEELK